MNMDTQTSLESRLAERLDRMEDELRAIRQELTDVSAKVHEALEWAAVAKRIVNHRVNDARRLGVNIPPEVPRDPDDLPPPKPHFLCKWLGHSPGPLMGLSTVCTRCQTVYRVGRGM